MKCSHADNQANLNQAEVDNSLFGTVDGAKIAVLSGAEVFLISGHRSQCAGDLEDRLLEDCSLLGRRALLRRQLGHRQPTSGRSSWIQARSRLVRVLSSRGSVN